MGSKIFGVTELNEHIKDLLDSDEVLNGVYVRGEISNYKLYPSGHHYFTMKDKDGSLRCVMFKGSAAKLRFRPENGMKVIAFGRVAVFPGRVSVVRQRADARRVGDLYVAFRQLKESFWKGCSTPATRSRSPVFPLRSPSSLPPQAPP